MRLIVSDLTNSERKFKHLFGIYPLAFKPWTHCAKCLQHKRVIAVRDGMSDGAYGLDDAMPFFYLCAVGKEQRKNPEDPLARRQTNVHLAVRPNKGSTAKVKSVYGATFIIEDAERIAIQPLTQEMFPHLDDQHWGCKNFQFGWQMFNARPEHTHGPGEIITELR